MRVLRGIRCFSSLRSKVVPRVPGPYRYDRAQLPPTLSKFKRDVVERDIGAIPEGRIIAKDLTLGAKYFSAKHSLVPINEHLCDSCRQIIQGTGLEAEDILRNDYHGDFFKHLDASTIRHNAFSGCGICTAVWNRYSAELKSVQGFDILPLYFDYGVWWKADSRAYAIKFYVFGRESGQKDGEVQLLSTIVVTLEAMFRPSGVTTVEDVVAATRGEKRVPRQMQFHNSSTGSVRSLQQIRAWLDRCTCCENSTVSSRQNENGFMPKRLVEIDTQQNLVRIVRSNSFPSPVRYITLSHCWGTDISGSKTHIRMLESNLSEFESGIATDLLPKTFQDVVEVARFLDIRFLWIDSLCIIQDSNEDWEENAIVMGDVYQNAYLTLAATASNNSSQGLFRTRPPTTTSPCTIEVPEHTVFNKDIYSVYNDDDWSVFVDNAPLNKRGWVLQERLLSPRVVHFAENQLYFECIEFRASEQYPQELPKRVYSSKIRPRFSLRRKELDEALVLEIWNEVVSEYSSLQLSFTSDKKVAVFGISNKIKSVTENKRDDAYFAGHWVDWLEDQLGWETTTEARRATDRAVPSWSWLSIDGPVRPCFMPLHQLAESGLIRAIPMLMAVMESDEVTDSVGYLFIEGPIFRLTGIKPKSPTERSAPTVSFAEAKQDLVRRITRSRPGYTGESLITLGFSHNGLPCGPTGLNAKSFDFANGIYVSHSPGDELESPDLDYAPLRQFKFDIGGFYAAESTYRETASYDNEADTGSASEQIEPALPLYARFPLFEHALVKGPRQLVGEMTMDEDFDCEQLQSMGPLFIPLYSMSSPDYLEVNHLKGLVVVEADGPFPATYRRIGVATLSNEETCAFLCALGNQENDSSFKPIKSDTPSEQLERKEMADMVPATWAWKDMAYLPKDFAVHRIWIK